MGFFSSVNHSIDQFTKFRDLFHVSEYMYFNPSHMSSFSKGFVVALMTIWIKSPSISSVLPVDAIDLYCSANDVKPVLHPKAMTCEGAQANTFDFRCDSNAFDFRGTVSCAGKPSLAECAGGKGTVLCEVRNQRVEISCERGSNRATVSDPPMISCINGQTRIKPRCAARRGQTGKFSGQLRCAGGSKFQFIDSYHVVVGNPCPGKTMFCNPRNSGHIRN